MTQPLSETVTAACPQCGSTVSGAVVKVGDTVVGLRFSCVPPCTHHWQIEVAYTQCQAHNRRGDQCRRNAVWGSRVCYYHGGAPGSGAPNGNQNSRKHGFYSRTIPAELQHKIEEAQSVSGVDEEIALMRALVDEAVNQGAELREVAVGTAELARLLRIKYRIEEK